jgi:hypothetical protein
MWDTYSEGSENASEFNVGNVGLGDPRARDGMDALGVQGNQIRRYIHSFDDACVSAYLWVSLFNLHAVQTAP